MSEPRITIENHVANNPGVHFNKLVRALNLAPGQVQYHVRRLLSDDTVVREQLYGQTHYYPPKYDSWERRAIALLHRETARDILIHLMMNGPARPGDTADSLDIARSTLEWHLTRLVEQDLVRKRRDERNRVTLVLEREADTAKLMADVSPSLSERMVDRFTRLVDHLVE